VLCAGDCLAGLPGFVATAGFVCAAMPAASSDSDSGKAITTAVVIEFRQKAFIDASAPANTEGTI